MVGSLSDIFFVLSVILGLVLEIWGLLLGAFNNLNLLSCDGHLFRFLKLLPFFLQLLLTNLFK